MKMWARSSVFGVPFMPANKLLSREEILQRIADEKAKNSASKYPSLVPSETSEPDSQNSHFAESEWPLEGTQRNGSRPRPPAYGDRRPRLGARQYPDRPLVGRRRDLS